MYTRIPSLRPSLPLFPLSLLLLLCMGTASYSKSPSSPPIPDRYILQKSLLSGRTEAAREYVDPSLPPVFPAETPVCSVPLLQHDFAHTVGSPPASAIYNPPESCRWTHAVLEFSATCAGEQHDRIAAVWIDGVEVLRTSTAESTKSGVSWNVRKDVTRYSSLLVKNEGGGGGRRRNPRVVSVMLENVVNDVYTGVYHVKVSLDFYGRAANEASVRELAESGLNSVDRESSEEKLGNLPAEWGNDPIELGEEENPPIEELGVRPWISAGKGASQTNKGQILNILSDKPADLIIPISNEKGSHEGFWFRIQNEADVRTKSIRIPKNAYKAVLEIYVSFHSHDEFWYSNPPNSYIEQNNLTTKRGNGAFREVYATIDGLYAGSAMAFPVVFTGGFNPLFWAPVVAIGAFNLPSYDLDVTPFLGNLLNGGRSHKFGLGVGYGIPFWLVNANLHLWLDSHPVAAKLVKHKGPPCSVSHSSKSHFLDGLFKLEAQRGAHFSGWVSSSLGNLTFVLQQQFKYKSTLKFKDNGNIKAVYSKSKYKTDVQIYKTDVKILQGPKLVLAARAFHKAKYPIQIITETLPGEDHTYIRTNLSHVMYENFAVTLDQVPSLSSIVNSQIAEGWMQVRDHSVLSGSASTLQTYKRIDNGVCYIRKVSVQDGSVLNDQSSTDCAFAS